MMAPENLYYYCSLSTFVSIIKNSSVWLTDITKSNDSMELQYLYNQCMKEILCPFFDISKPLYDDLSFRYKGIMDLILPSVWALCLSKERDLLSQWRGYADDGSGICIRFKGDYVNLFSNRFEQTKYKKCELRPIIYSTDLITAEYKTRIVDYITTHSDIEHNINKLEAYIEQCIHEFVPDSPYYKKDSFHEENEWRLVITSPHGIKELKSGYRDINEKKDFEPINFDYAICKGRLISHFELHINPEEAIGEVFIGPASKVTRQDIKNFLHTHNINNIIVNLSESSYQSN